MADVASLRVRTVGSTQSMLAQGQGGGINLAVIVNGDNYGVDPIVAKAEKAVAEGLGPAH